MGGTNAKRCKIILNFLGNQFFEHSRRRGVENIKTGTPTQHGDQKNKCFPPSMGITFLIFATSLARERQFRRMRFARIGAQRLLMRCQKWQCFIRCVVKNKKKIAVVGAGPAGMSFSCVAAERGHDVTMFDGSDEIGGQFNIAKQIPGKEEFHETIRYFTKRIKKASVNVKLNTIVEVNDLKDFDVIILSTIPVENAWLIATASSLVGFIPVNSAILIVAEL